MPRRSSLQSEPGVMLDSWGRANRKLGDKPCAQCGAGGAP